MRWCTISQVVLWVPWLLGSEPCSGGSEITTQSLLIDCGRQNQATEQGEKSGLGEIGGQGWQIN